MQLVEEIQVATPSRIISCIFRNPEGSFISKDQRMIKPLFGDFIEGARQLTHGFVDTDRTVV